ncbi:MAG: hypothetical protein PHQ66_03085 [Candidatus Nanoarchaeia archaeon]|nr:hypothetical protein [Candidatus Nanoarchaeia archaeon]MDD5357649.1 hypothetical protein [Candidatus Nanoarchaeia archaeon]MDD5588568.1 hypothetical protein [Candidatus Nanoarchaeia archaeon]
MKYRLTSDKRTLGYMHVLETVEKIGEKEKYTRIINPEYFHDIDKFIKINMLELDSNKNLTRIIREFKRIK